MSELIKRNLGLPQELYRGVGQCVFQQVGLSLIDFAEQNPESAYLTIIDFVAVQAKRVEAVSSVDAPIVAPETSENPVSSAIAEQDIRKHYLEDVAGKKVAAAFAVVEKRGLWARLRNKPIDPDPILSFVADLSLVHPDLWASLL